MNKVNFYVILVCFIVKQVTSDCPERCFCQTSYVKCMQASLQAVPPGLSSNISVLDLRVNEIKDLKLNSFSTSPNLETLLLNNNQISILRNGVFDNLSKLRHLHLHRNKIGTIEPEAFKNLQNLEQLYLHYNNIVQLGDGIFKNLVHLERLFLFNNNVENIQTDVFATLSNIKTLRLDSNPLNCDCELFWLLDYLSSDPRKGVQISGVCQSPSSLHGKSLPDLKSSDEFRQCRYPKIVTQPEDIEASQQGSQSVLLLCKARGYPKPRISWKKDGYNIDFGNGKYDQESDGLVIKSISLADEGKYECIASNDVATVKSRSAVLKINRAKEVLLSKNVTGKVSPDNVAIRENESVQIDCILSENPNVHLAWLKNNIMVPDNYTTSKVSETGSFIFSLHLNQAQLDDSGRYHCMSTEPSTTIYGSSEVIVDAAPEIIRFSRNLAVGSGSIVELECIAKGHPIPLFTWFKDGRSVVPNSRITFKENKNILKIENVLESDTGMYTCLAQNTIGSVERNMELRVKNRGSRVPRIVIKPFDIDVPQFSSVEIPCKVDGEPKPHILWLKNNEPIVEDRIKFRMNNIGSLRIYNVSLIDSGVYECIAKNTLGNDTARGILTVIGDFQSENDVYILQAYNEAKLEIDRAINATINHLFSQKQSDKSPGFLMNFFRYPDEISRNIVKSADIYTRTLANVRRHISSGLNLNITNNFSYEELLTQSQIELIANISGCVSHQPIVNCSNTEFHSKYSTFDGTCNNLANPMWGSSYTAFRRILNPIYENGFSTPVGWNKGVKYYGYPKPQARLVSTSLIRTYDITPDEEITHMVMQWGQFLDHDLDHALPSTTLESWEGLDCKKTCAYSEPCFPMEVPRNDTRIKNRRCMDFIRSSAVCGSGTTSVFFHKLQPRQQLNQLTSYIDASQVYGFIRDRSFLLRDLLSDLGLLRGGVVTNGGHVYLPTAGLNEVDCRRDLNESNTGCFLAGDIRVNEQVGLIAIHTIWFREHNRLATQLREINPHWDGDKLYFEARKILIAELQHITYQHWLEKIIGPEGMKALGKYAGYKPNVDATISNVFATAALRMGHSLINPELARLDENFKVIPQGNLPLGKAFFAPWRLISEGGVDPLIRGFFTASAKRKKPTENLNDQLIDELFTAAHAVSLDLAAMNIQRSRDHGLPGYTEYRKFCNLSVPENFDQLKKDISSDEIRHKLEQLYGHPGNIDVWVGGILEDQLKNARVGPLFQCLLVEQFQRLRDGDRFWYENPTTFTPSQLSAIKKVTLSRVLCDNSDNLTRITEDVFILPNLQKSKYISCDAVPKLDLKPWLNSKP
ncbi:peroxidasin [Planococcus citri]|uniref:peroxidasin n=1 Tax=Planococcus citri TaxID=170843 RepID=UPI0031F91B18